FIVLDRKERAVQEFVDVLVIALRHELERLRHAIGRLDQSVAARRFPERLQQSRDQRPDLLRIRRRADWREILEELQGTVTCLCHSGSYFLSCKVAGAAYSK